MQLRGRVPRSPRPTLVASGRMGHGCTYEPHVVLSEFMRRGDDCGACGKPWAKEPEPPTPPPVLLAITPNNGSTSGGLASVVQCQAGDTLADVTAIMYGDVPGVNLRGSNPTQRIVDSPPADESGPVSVTAVTPRGVSNAVQFFYN